MKLRARKDWNQAGIVNALRSIGVTVFVVNQAGLADLLTYSRGTWLPIEIKRPRGKLTPAQIATRRLAPFPVVETVAQALALFGCKS